MIRVEKLSQALHAMHGILIRARFMAGKDESLKQIAALMDQAEFMQIMIASDIDETEQFRLYLGEVGRQYSCEYLIQEFDGPDPGKWYGDRI